MPDQLAPAPQLRSWTRQGVDVSLLMQAAEDAVAAAEAARLSATRAEAAAAAAVAALAAGSPGSGGSSLITPSSIQGITQVGADLLVAPGANYAAQQQSARTIIGAPKVGTAATDAARGTLVADVTALAARVTSLENSGVGGTIKDNIDVDTDGVPIWID